VAAAAILMAGISVSVFGFMIVTHRANPRLEDDGHLRGGGRTALGQDRLRARRVVVALDVPAALWRGKDVHFGRVWTAPLRLLAPGFLGSLPLVYEMFTAR
jgi:hypothetical protein